MRVFRIHRFRFTHPLRLCVHVLVCVLRGFGIRLLSLYSRFVRNRLATLYCFFFSASLPLSHFDFCRVLPCLLIVSCEQWDSSGRDWHDDDEVILQSFRERKMHTLAHAQRITLHAVNRNGYGSLLTFYWWSCVHAATCTTERHSPFSISLKYDSKIWTKFWWFRE